MTVYSYGQLKQIWINAGGNPAVAPLAAAVAMAESSGRSDASLTDSNGTVDRGLWQINSSHGAQSTYDVMGNARAAVAISNNGANWSPWVTYQTGAYKQYLSGASAAQLQQYTASSGSSGSAAASNTLDSSAGSWWNPLNWPSKIPGVSQINNDLNPAHWAVSFGNAIVTAFETVFKDILNFVIGTAEILFGMWLFIVCLDKLANDMGMELPWQGMLQRTMMAGRMIGMGI